MAKNDTRLRMIEAALDLFHLQGVNATSIDQVLAKSSTGKSQFTHYFKNKDGLIRAVVQFLVEVIRSGVAPTGYEVNSWQDFERWFQQYIDFQKATSFERSCPIGTIASDLSNEQELIRQDVRIFLDWTHNQLARFFAERRAAGELPETSNPDQLADLCLTIMQGGMLLTKIRRNPDMFENAAAQAMAFIQSIRITRGEVSHPGKIHR